MITVNNYFSSLDIGFADTRLTYFLNFGLLYQTWNVALFLLKRFT